MYKSNKCKHDYVTLGNVYKYCVAGWLWKKRGTKVNVKTIIADESLWDISVVRKELRGSSRDGSFCAY